MPPYSALLQVGFGRRGVAAYGRTLLPSDFTLAASSRRCSEKPLSHPQFELEAVCFCATFRLPTMPEAWELPSTLSSGARTFLPLARPVSRSHGTAATRSPRLSAGDFSTGYRRGQRNLRKVKISARLYLLRGNNNPKGAGIVVEGEIPVRGVYPGKSILPQLLQVTVYRPERTRCKCWVGRDIRHPWHKPRSTLATAVPPLLRRRVSYFMTSA